MTLNLNGQNITITDQGDNITINSPTQTPTPTATPTLTATVTPAPIATATATPAPVAPLSVTFISYGPNHSPIGNGTQYDFNVTVNAPTSLNYPWGKNVTHDKLGQALVPLTAKYSLVTSNSSGFTTAAWQNKGSCRRRKHLQPLEHHPANKRPNTILNHRPLQRLHNRNDVKQLFLLN